MGKRRFLIKDGSKMFQASAGTEWCANHWPPDCPETLEKNRVRKLDIYFFLPAALVDLMNRLGKSDDYFWWPHDHIPELVDEKGTRSFTLIDHIGRTAEPLASCKYKVRSPQSNSATGESLVPSYGNFCGTNPFEFGDFHCHDRASPDLLPRCSVHPGARWWQLITCQSS